MAHVGRSQAQAARLLGLTALVALAHGWLLALLGDRATLPATGTAAPHAVVTLVHAPPLPPVLSGADAQALASVTPTPAAPAARSPPASAIDAAAEAQDAPPAPQRDDGEPPPVYATRVPPPITLRFAARINGVDGAAELHWQHDGERYRLALRVQGPARPLLEQRSEGGFDAAGLAPDRFVDLRRGRTVGAAHFRRDIGRISFSGPRIDYPAWPGAQDRLAWLPQLVAVLAASPDPPDELRFFVADARGVARAWIFRVLGSEMVESATGPVPALKLLREPPRSDDLRVTVWLDPAQGHWPVRLEFGVPISGAMFELTRAESAPVEPLPGQVGP